MFPLTIADSSVVVSGSSCGGGSCQGSRGMQGTGHEYRHGYHIYTKTGSSSSTTLKARILSIG